MNWKKILIAMILSLINLLNEIANYGVYDLSGAIAYYLGGFVGAYVLVEVGDRIYNWYRSR